VDTTGALLFTSNGMLAHHLLAPDFHVAKLYRATLRKMEPLSVEAIAQLAAGVTLRSKGQMVCRGIARNVPGRPGVVELNIDSGAFHQVGSSLSSTHPATRNA
jgi:16S rRNA pseudouridine516 synthase